jgi:lysophospholipid acyltransferase (LPLAT)-like uncharacterized protein
VASTYTLKQRLLLAIVPRVVSTLALCLGATLRYEHVCEPGAATGFDVPAPAIYAFWHRCLLAGVWPFRNQGLTILISRSFDGELIARVADRLGFLHVRGSSSRDGAPGLRNMQRAYLAGHYCGITADGPRGPAMVAKAGVAQLAQLVDTTVNACYVHPHRAWQLRSWDRFLIPKPFSKVTVAWTRPVSADLLSVQAALDRSVELAQSGSSRSHHEKTT